MKKITLVFILMALAFAVNAQNERKTYKGTYGKEQDWTAEYTYYDNPEGGRIYDGPFIQQKDKYYKKGNFVNNKQDGHWVMFYPHPGSNGNCYLEVEYDNGIINGPILYQYKSGDRILQEIKANVENGVFNGMYECNDPDMPKYTVGNIKGNLPVGKWVTKYREGNAIYEIKEIGQGQYEINRFDEDSQTGDITKHAPKSVQRKELWSNIGQMSILYDKLKTNNMRDSQLPNVPGVR